MALLVRALTDPPARDSLAVRLALDSQNRLDYLSDTAACWHFADLHRRPCRRYRAHCDEGRAPSCGYYAADRAEGSGCRPPLPV